MSIASLVRKHRVYLNSCTRSSHTLSSVIDHLPQSVAKFHEIVADRASGCHVWDTSGRQLFDLTSGIGVTSTGHSHPKVIQAIHEQANKIIFAQQNILPATEVSINLVQHLKDIMPPTLSRYFFCNSGSEAVDNAIKVARSYTGKQNIIAMQGGYHGRTYGAMSVTTSKTVYRQTFGPMPSGVVVANYPYCLHCHTRKAAGGLDFSVAPCVPGVGKNYADRKCCNSPVQDLRMLLKMQSHPSETAAIIIEPILGEGGFLVPPPGFLEELRTICHENNMLLIFDEVQSGVGRTGEWWGYQSIAPNVTPDIIIFAKGIASGFPFAGLATKDDLFKNMAPGMMGGTYGGSALGCAAAVGTLEAIKQENMLSNAKDRGAQFMKRLVDMSNKYPIAEIRGRGLMIAIEFDAPPGTASKVIQEGYEEGLILITAGVRETVRLLPPLVITEQEVDQALDSLDRSSTQNFLARKFSADSNQEYSVATQSKEMTDPQISHLQSMDRDDVIDCTFASRYMTEPIPKSVMPESSIPAKVVHQVIKDLRTLDARPNLNLASFVTTWMEPEVEQLIMDSLNINFVDTDEYPSCQEISNRCVAMLAQLFHSPSVDSLGRGDAVGAPTVGSSEAIMLSGLAMKKRWQEMRAAKGLDATKPNIVMGNQTHVCWEKFCRYWDVEGRYVEVEEGRYCATPELVAAQCDENTIGVVAVFGSTYTGEFEDVEGLDKEVSRLNEENGWSIVIHVDGASGAMVAPFVYPDLKFDFRLPNVASINISGHKYGLVYPGLGWAIWRDPEHLPESMVFYCDYLGTVERSITLNFSRGASQIIAQYYQLLRLGREGYTKIMSNLSGIARYIKSEIEKSGHFEILSQDVGVPLVAFRLNKVKGNHGGEHRRLYDEFQLADRMRIAGWVLPAYKMPKGAEHVKLMRITIREDFSMTMADQVIQKLNESVEWLDDHFTISKDELNELAGKTMGRAFSRLDSKVLGSFSDLIRPC